MSRRAARAVACSAMVLGSIASAPAMAAGLHTSTRLDLSSAPVPAGLCTHPAGRLVKGERHFGTHGDDAISHTAYGAIHGGATALAVISCTAGGVAWPDTVILYRADARGRAVIVASYDLGRLSGAEHVVVTSLAIRDGLVHVVTDSYEGAGIEVQQITANLHAKSGKVVVSDVHRGPKVIMPTQRQRGH